MAFTLGKNTSGRIPDLIKHIPAGATLGDSPASIVNGLALTFDDVNGAFEVAATGGPVAAYSVMNYGGTLFALDAQGNSQGVATAPGGTLELLVQPVRDNVEIVADIGTPAVIAIGDTLDIEAGGLTLGTALNNDFKVTRIVSTDASGNVTKVGGYFTNVEAV